jgi:23S rRNA (cytosine1962-C5)-methyltransferase
MGIRHVEVGPAAVETIRRGHPWIWERAVRRGLDGARAGEEVALAGSDGKILARGIADPGSPIVARVWSLHDERIGHELFDERIRAAFAIRKRLFADGATTAYRLLHGEGDRVPGFVLDRYGDAAILRIDGEGARAHHEAFTHALRPHLDELGVRALSLREGKKGEAVRFTNVFGEAPERVTVTEHGVPFVVDLLHGQKTGAFLDQRENRRRVFAMARGRKVLNLFSYAGGFSLNAALGGASHVTSVDIAAGGHAAAQASFRAAGVDPRAHAFATADAFAFLAEAKRKKTVWDLVISDPPSFAASEKAVARALGAYRSLHRACADVLAPQGIFCASSCSSHVDGESFIATLDDVALGRSDLRLLENHGSPADHPTLPAWREGRYLKFVVLA